MRGTLLLAKRKRGSWRRPVRSMDGRRTIRTAVVLAAALGLAACATAAPKRGWDDVGVTGSPLPGPDPGQEPPGGDESPVETPLDFPSPSGGRLLATFEGPIAAAPSADLLLPADLVRPFLPEGQAGRRDLPVAGLLDLDVDGDGADELVALATIEGPVPGAVLVVLRRDGTVAYGWPLAGLRDGRHTCHAEWVLAGSLARGRARLPVVYEERGVGCGAFEGGGFDRRVLVYAPDFRGSLEALVGRARLGKGGAADVNEAVVYAADRDRDGIEELWVRGISRGIRPCGAADPPYLVEELAWRVVSWSGTVAIRGSKVTPLEGGVLPATLLVSRHAPCGRAARPEEQR